MVPPLWYAAASGKARVSKKKRPRGRFFFDSATGGAYRPMADSAAPKIRPAKVLTLCEPCVKRRAL